MNIVKVGVAVLAASAMIHSYAQDAEEAEVVENAPVQVERSYGWTAVAFGLATPVQLPWGWNKWDVFGFDLSILLSQAPLMYGFEFGGLGSMTSREMLGWNASGLFNWDNGEVYGMRTTLGLNYNDGKTVGLDLGGIGWHKDFTGLEIELACCVQENVWGCNASLLGSYTSNESHGCTMGALNFASKAYGAQVAFAYNQAEELHGCQIGLVNYARECPWGFQVGIVNIILDNKIKVLPLVNCYF